MSSIVIKEVKGRSALRRFITFPNKLFKNVPTYIPPLNSDEIKLLTPKNPSWEHCDCALYLAYRGDEIVGRVAAIINRTVNEHWNKKSVRFGWCDFINDYSVFEALIKQVADYGRSHGMDELEGPFGFTDMDKECWVTDNFDARQNLSTLYNPEYYVRFVERMGMEVKCRWQQYKIPANQPVPEKVAKINEIVKERYGVRVLHFKKRKEIYPYARKFFLTLNDTFKDLYDFVPLTDKEIDVYINEYFPFINLDYANFVVDKDDNLVAFGLSIPDLSEAYKKANGSLFPFGWYHLLKALRRFDTIDLLLNGVHPEWQRRGVHSLYYAEMNRNAIRDGVTTAYSNPQIIGNEAVKIWETQFQAEPLMQRAVWGMKI